ncbi:hypothetical protein F01_290023 [Burkholderia cenocepacia]|nr:hypothetical protein F01_290023 [Burkholderia cenocepacia]
MTGAADERRRGGRLGRGAHGPILTESKSPDPVGRRIATAGWRSEHCGARPAAPFRHVF